MWPKGSWGGVPASRPHDDASLQRGGNHGTDSQASKSAVHPTANSRWCRRLTAFVRQHGAPAIQLRMASVEAITVLLECACTQADAPTCLTAADDGVRVGDENFQFSHVFYQAASRTSAPACRALRGRDHATRLQLDGDGLRSDRKGKTHTLGTAQAATPVSSRIRSVPLRLGSAAAAVGRGVVRRDLPGESQGPAGASRRGAHEARSFSKATKQKVAPCEQALAVLAGCGPAHPASDPNELRLVGRPRGFAMNRDLGARRPPSTPKLLFLDPA